MLKEKKTEAAEDQADEQPVAEVEEVGVARDRRAGWSESLQATEVAVAPRLAVATDGRLVLVPDEVGQPETQIDGDAGEGSHQRSQWPRAHPRWSAYFDVPPSAGGSSGAAARPIRGGPR